MRAVRAEQGAGLGRGGATAERAVIDALAALMAVASPAGRERELAERFLAWGRAAYPDLEWKLDAIDDASAGIRVSAGSGAPRRELGLYAHLDTSLTADTGRDRQVTGETDAPEAFRVAGRSLRGLGVGIAKAPAAAALVALDAATRTLRAGGTPHRLTLLLAAGGTHRAAPADRPADPVLFGRGVRHVLEGGWRPAAVLNVKGGPPGVLHEEPSSAYLRVRVRSRWTAGLMRSRAAPEGGLLRHAGTVIDAIESWRAEHLRAHPPQGQLGGEVAIGAVRGGSPEKADLIPGLLEVFIYVVGAADADPAATARELAAYLAPRVAVLPDGATCEVDAYAYAPGGTTDPASEIVSLAREAWRAHLPGDPDAVRGWTGATDGPHFQRAGIPTARFGAPVVRDPRDPRIEIVELDELLACARAWTDVAVRYSGA